MQRPPMAVVEDRKRTFVKGTRVRLVNYGPSSLIDDNEIVPRGTEGTVTHVDDWGTVAVEWDNGRSLGVLYYGDEIEVVAREASS